MSAGTAQITTDELLAMPDDGIRRWIINGELREGGLVGFGELIPSWPKLLAPQQNAEPPETAHVWLAPAATREPKRFSPATLEVALVFPLPTWPEELTPQQ